MCTLPSEFIGALDYVFAGAYIGVASTLLTGDMLFNKAAISPRHEPKPSTSDGYDPKSSG